MAPAKTSKGAPAMEPPNAPESELSMTENNSNTNPNETPRLLRLADLIGDLETDTQFRYEAKQAGRMLGPSTSIDKLDEILGEYLAPGLHLVQGAPGAGKTACGLQMGGRCGFPCLYLTTEMPPIELLRRTTARETKTYLSKLKTGELGPKETVRLAKEAAKKCPNLALVDAMRGTITPLQITTLAAALREAAESRDILIILDSAQAWIRQRMNGSGRDEYNETNAAIGDLLEIADTLKCPIVSISHKNREGNKGNAVQAHSSKGSGSWEYMIESGIDLSRDDEAGKDENDTFTVWANVWKNRNGEPNIKQALRFHGGFQSFEEDLRPRTGAAKWKSRSTSVKIGNGKNSSPSPEEF